MFKSACYGDGTNLNTFKEERTMIAVSTYLAYLAITVPLTVWVATILSRSGRALLADVFPDDDLADAANRLLVTGFHLLGLGAALLLMRGGAEPVSVQDMLAVLSVKVGALALLLGLLHLVNVAVLNAIRRHGRGLQLDTPPMPSPAGPWHPAPAVEARYAAQVRR